MPYRVSARPQTRRASSLSLPDDARHARRAALAVGFGLAAIFGLASLGAELAWSRPGSAFDLASPRHVPPSAAFAWAPSTTRIVPVTALAFPFNRPGPEWGATAGVEGSRFGAGGSRVVYHFPPPP
jgi:hypothetical protein